MKFDSIDCRHVGDHGELKDWGDFRYRKAGAGIIRPSPGVVCEIIIRLPCKEDGEHPRCLPVYKKGQPEPADGAWLWNGNIAKPTLSPSIDAKGIDGESVWHGHLKDGRLEGVER